MYRQKKSNDPGNLRILSIVLAVAGLIILFRIPPARMLGFVLIGAGAFGLVWSLIASGKDRSTREDEDHRRFFN